MQSVFFKAIHFPERRTHMFVELLLASIVSQQQLPQRATVIFADLQATGLNQ